MLAIMGRATLELSLGFFFGAWVFAQDVDVGRKDGPNSRWSWMAAT